MQKKVQILIPAGSFEGNCEDCIHACRTYQDKGNPDKDNREMYCGMFRNYFYPKDVEEKKCAHFKMRLWAKIKRILVVIFYIWIFGVIAEILIMLFS